MSVPRGARNASRGPHSHSHSRRRRRRRNTLRCCAAVGALRAAGAGFGAGAASVRARRARQARLRRGLRTGDGAGRRAWFRGWQLRWLVDWLQSWARDRLGRRLGRTELAQHIDFPWHTDGQGAHHCGSRYDFAQRIFRFIHIHRNEILQSPSLPEVARAEALSCLGQWEHSLQEARFFPYAL